MSREIDKRTEEGGGGGGKKKEEDVRMTDAVHFYYQIRDMLKEEANESKRQKQLVRCSQVEQLRSLSLSPFKQTER